MVGWVLALAVLAGCGVDDTAPTASNDVEAQAAIAAFTRYWDEAVAIANTGRVPRNAFAMTVTGPLRDDEVERATRDAQAGVTRVGAPEFRDHRATIDGDSAVVVVCINEDDWAFVLPDHEPRRPHDGWRMLARELTRVDGVWLVSDYSPVSSRDSCE